MTLATLNGQRVTWLRAQIPAWGTWYADVETDAFDATTGPAVLTIDDLTLRGAILSTGLCEVRRRYRLVGGAGGWGRVVPAASYSNDAGVKISAVVGDVARACGETIGASSAASLGPSWVRPEGPAARTLDAVSPRAWYVDAAGVTHLGRRPRVLFDGPDVRTVEDHAKGRIEIAPAPGGVSRFAPGVVVDGLEAVDVEITLDGPLRVVLWGRGPADSSRLPSALRRHVEAATASHKFFAPWEYRVIATTGDRADLQCARVSAGMPDLRRVRVRPPSGVLVRPALGSTVIVQFVNGDPARPYVCAGDEQDGPGGLASELLFQAGSTGAAPTEHATSAEALVLAMRETVKLIGAALTVDKAAVEALAVDAAFATWVSGVLASSSFASTPLTKAAIAANLLSKSPNTNGNAPGLGWPKVRGG